jgi:hypothetical protein
MATIPFAGQALLARIPDELGLLFGGDRAWKARVKPQVMTSLHQQPRGLFFLGPKVPCVCASCLRITCGAGPPLLN